MTGTNTVQRAKILVSHEFGLCMWPATLLVRLAREFDARVMLECDRRMANAKSLLSVITLGAAYGKEVIVTAEGPDAHTAVLAVTDLFARRFDAGVVDRERRSDPAAQTGAPTPAAAPTA
jgi:phosphotransferase system HPr (HPr) family protein